MTTVLVVATGAFVEFVEVAIVEGGHSANSHFGPVRPTALPSGQIFASRLQETYSGILYL
jgi:hypothetical protein